MSVKPKIASLGNKGPYIDAAFDQASLGSYSIVDSSTPEIRLTPIKHWNNNWAHWAIRSKHFAGKAPHFRIDKQSHYGYDVNERLCCWATSIDTDSWSDFDNVSTDGNDFVFYNNTPFPSGTIYIAPLPMYPLGRVTRHIAEWSLDPRVVQTESSTNFIVGNTTSRSAGDGSGRIIPALPIYGFKITRSSSKTKSNVVITAGSHPSETHGLYQMEGTIEFLLGGSAEAEDLLDYFDFFVYPCINPQGVWTGWFRSNPEAPTQDHNRIWDTDGTYEDVDILKAAILADTGSSAVACIDYHGWMSAQGAFFTATSIAPQVYVDLLAFIKRYRPAYTAQDSDLPTSIKAWQEATLSPTIAIGPEIGGAKTYSASTYKTVGSEVIRGVGMLNRYGRFPNSPIPGSRSHNGSTDRLDFPSVATLTSSPITISTWANSSGNVAGASDYLFHIHAPGNTNYGVVFYLYPTNLVGFIRNSSGGAGQYLWKVMGDITWGGGWHNFVVTHDGNFATHSSIHIYCDGVELTTVSGTQDGSGTEIVPSGSISLGGRIYDDLRNLPGMQAETGLWNRVITPTELANLALGYAPDLAAPSDLLFYFKGNTSSLVASPGGEGTADGTTFVSGAGNGPPILR